jgi:drug/metabolite transporter (DMT)-like permease
MARVRAEPGIPVEFGVGLDLPSALDAMNNLVLYAAAVLIWGSTWRVITFQLGRVPPEVSVAYRFALAGVLLLIWCRLRGLRMRFSAREHLLMALQGMLLFGLNYVCIYLAEGRISSGLVAVLFSLITFFNIAGTRIFFGTPVKWMTLFSAVLGVVGVTLIFLPELREPGFGGSVPMGVFFAVLGTMSASFGNLLAARNQRNGLPVVQLNTFGMLYGALLVTAYALAIGRPFGFDGSLVYLASLGYLSLFGSILAFGAYLTLVGRIGADRAGYTGATIPIVAVLLSVVFEGLRLQAVAVLGIALCLAGNVLVLRGRRSPTPAAPIRGAGLPR